ncbi:hypothetical protein [Asinibacterium sp. OR53]|uniref:hypothetical protein n=1 Tax=Asinibacterium sp. OR53 TaxID=925409 RepID=UPI00047A187C|nr:hypothetical protein [Asinibacterium sp. OR53]
MKVIGFDSWTQGWRNYNRLVDSFKEKGIDFDLIHLGSWGTEPGRPTEEVIDKLSVKDIRFYKGKTFLEILDLEKPAAVIFLSTDAFAHRAFNRYCKKRHIPTLHLSNGLGRVQAIGKGSRYKLKLTTHIAYVLSSFGRALKKVYPTYVKSLIVTKAPLNDWIRFIRDNFSGALGFPSFRSAPDAKTDKCCVFIKADVEHAINKYGYTKEEIIVVGNPDLIRFKMPETAIGSYIRNGGVSHNDIMYIDTGLIYTGWAFSSPDEFIQHIISTKEIIEQNGKHFVLKPHPLHLESGIASRLIQAGCDLCTDNDFIDRLQKCLTCIVEPSTIALLPNLTGMPVMLAQYGKVTGSPFGEILATYPRAIPIYNLTEIMTLLENEKKNLNIDKVRYWIEQNSGPLPAQEMPDRVTETVCEMIRRR